MHFLHQRSIVEAKEGRKVIPLLFVHGWPGSFVEVTKMLPLLLGGEGGRDGVVFDVVAPSLIDFGFSDENTEVSYSFLSKWSWNKVNRFTEGFSDRSTGGSMSQIDACSWV